MQNAESHDVVTLENQITERYGLLISQTQLAELLGRTTGGLRYSLSYPSDQSTRALKACGRKIGRRVPSGCTRPAGTGWFPYWRTPSMARPWWSPTMPPHPARCLPAMPVTCWHRLSRVTWKR